jgi:tRNA dimethylallyltransferase
VSARPQLTIIAGPTAAGKSALALDLAVRTGAEIVSADSQAVYRHFDIGTAKPDAEALARVPHHLISVVDPLEQFTAARFQALADEAIRDIARRGRRVLVVGGTGLYVRALLHGLSDAPPDPELRARLEEELERTGAAAIHARLAAIDPASAARIPAADSLRIIRALEIHAVTGVPASAVREAHRFDADRYPYTLWFLDPPREALVDAIRARTRKMFASGLVDEVRRLVGLGYRGAPAMASVGYRQALAAVDGRMSPAAAQAETEAETRAFAKRQRTWFRKEAGVRFVSPPYDAVAASDSSPPKTRT